MLLEEVGAMELTIMKKCKVAKDKGQEGQKRKLGKVQWLHVREMIDTMSALKKCETGDRMINRRGNHLAADENSII